MHHLALFAMALMLCMPVLSRWQQGMEHAVQADADDMCLSEMSRAALDVEEHAGHARLHERGHDHPADGGSPAHDPHLDHGAACGYCTLATRLLPVVALALAVPLLPPAQYFGIPALPAAPAARFWPAHTPRGPPLVS